MHVTRALFALSALVTATAAHAEKVTIDGYTLDLAIPKGTCTLDRARPTEVTYMDRIASTIGRGELLLVFADCDKLQSLRAGNQVQLTSGYWAAIYANPAIPRPTRTTVDRATMLREAGNSLTAPAAEEAYRAGQQRAQETLSSTQPGMQVQGEPPRKLAQDDDALYIGTVLHLTTPTGTANVRTVNALTLVGGYPVGLYLSGVDAPGLEESLLSQARALAHETVASNSGSGTAGSSSSGSRDINWTRVVLVGVAFAVVAFIVAMLRQRRRLR